MAATIDNRVAELERTNAQLRRQLDACSAELKEARNQQTATAEVLGVINSSPGDLAPVFDAMLGKARRLCEAELGLLLIYEGDCFRAVSLHGAPEAYVEFMTREPIRPGPNTGLERLVRQQRLVHIADLSAEQAYRERDPLRVASVELAGMRTFLAVPLVKEEALLGAFVLYRQEVRPFTDKQIALLQNFAAQAVIAMENARLLTETREALEQQTATAEVLQVINSSPGDLAPVFDAILEKAHNLCGAVHGALATYDGERFRAVATHGVPEPLEGLLRTPFRPEPGGPHELLLGGQRLIHIADQAAQGQTNPIGRASVEIVGTRTLLFIPLCKNDVLLGYISAFRPEVRPFSDKQIALLQNFAAQAVIAMENARLITETREALEKQTATAEVLQVINSSPGDLAPVFDAILEKAHSLCGIALGELELNEDGKFHAVAVRGVPGPLAELLRQPFIPPPHTPLARLLAGEQVVQIADLSELARQRPDDPRAQAGVQYGLRTVLFVPLRKDDALLGFITAYRQEVRPFTDKQIALLQNFAAQAVIAMENARLLTETREALEQQTATAGVLQVINSSPGDLTPVFDAILEKAHTLCGATHGVLATYDGEHFRAVATHEFPVAFAELLRQPFRAEPGSPQDQLLRGERLVHIPDPSALSGPGWDTPRTRAAREAGLRALLMVPLRKDGRLLGYITANRREAGPFTDKQIALLENFAAQAVIAMENARLLTETREALEQQTATAEVLQVINSSPGNIAPVFDAMLEKATRLCEAPCSQLAIYDGEFFRFVAVHGESRYAEQQRRDPTPPSYGVTWLRIVGGAAIVHIADVLEDDGYFRTEPSTRALVDASGMRTVLAVALRKDEVLLGALTVYRQEVRPFSDQQIALLQNFAQQAVIAMENARLITETREALEQQTATAEVLQVINSSPGDLAPVFDAMLEKAMRLCEVDIGALWTYDGEMVQAAAVRGAPPQLTEFLRQGPRRPSAPQRWLMSGERVVQITDITTTRAYRDGDPLPRALADVGGVRTFLAVPLRKDDTILGNFAIYRRTPRPFSEKQIALLQNFAAQAVIAMENARLITETREALEQQTATAEVLQVINSSPGDLTPVFDTILEKAHTLCGAAHGALMAYDGEHFRAVAMQGMPEKFAELLRQPFRPSPGGPQERLLRGERLIHIPDAAVREQTTPIARAAVEAGERTVLFVPLRKDDALLGYITAHRKEMRPFADREIALIENFAAQAVIAMENARLITELRLRTGDLQESLDYQTATSDVLKVISQSGAELEPMLDTLVETAARICRAESGFIFRLHEGLYHMVASFGISVEYKNFQLRNPIAPGRGTLAGRTALEGGAVHIEDAAADPEYTRVEAVQLGRQRTMLGVPLIRDEALIGVITLARSRVEPFTEKQIALVATFADQAVIAIENARLFNELRERTTELGRSVEELKMLGEVGRAVSSTLDLRTVLSTILTASLGVTWANAGAVFRYSRAEHAFRLVEAMGWDEALTSSVRELRIAESESAMGEAVARRTPVQLPDLAQRTSYPLRDVTLGAGFRSALIVPLVGAERVFGAITLMRQEAGEFPPEAVRLMQTLASQSVLAIQNARLFREIADKSEQLALASQHKSQFLANMSHELRTPLNAILGYAELLVDGIYGVLPEKAQGVLERVQNNGKHLLALINDVLDLAKIEAGQLTLTLEDYGLAEVVRGVVTATEPLAVAKGLKFTAIVQEGMPMAHGDARRVSQVLLNLAGNAIKFTDAGEVEINASAANGQFLLTVRDTGPGIADADQERIFGEFQQIDNSDTRKKGGTGLGLAISKRMVEMQGGMISVESVLGAGSTFRVVLPVHVEPALEEAA